MNKKKGKKKEKKEQMEVERMRVQADVNKMMSNL
jgi:hypothetical protein